MHPLAPDLTQLKDDELSAKLNELNKKLNWAYRMGNGALVGQLRMIIEDYQSELTRRNQKVLEDLAKKSGDFDKIINIG